MVIFYIVHGIDLYDSYIKHLIGNPDFFYSEGDISINRHWIEYNVKKKTGKPMFFV